MSFQQKMLAAHDKKETDSDVRNILSDWAGWTGGWEVGVRKARAHAEFGNRFLDRGSGFFSRTGSEHRDATQDAA